MRSLLRSLLPLIPLIFAGCDRSVGSGTTADPEGTGTLDFALPAAFRAQMAPVADSLRVELRQGAILKSRSVALDGSVRIDGLDAGVWKISVGLYKTGGALAYFGEDTVRIHLGQVAKAVVTLRPSKGSVDIVIRLDDGTSNPIALQGEWFLRQVDTFRVAGASIPLRLDDSGNVTGTDGCNGIGGHYTATATSIRFGNDFYSTMMYCDIYATMPSVANALLKARFWKAANGELVLFDSLEAVILRYDRTPPVVLPPPSDWIRLDTIVGDTAGHRLVAVRLDTAIARDSGVELSVILPHPGLTVQLFLLPSFTEPLVVDTLNDATTGLKYRIAPSPAPPRLLVASLNLHPETAYIQVLTPAKIFVPWTAIAPYVRFEDLSGRTINLLRPGFGLL